MFLALAQRQEDLKALILKEKTKKPAGSLLNVLPKKALDRLDCEGLTLKPSNIMVRAFDGSKRTVHGEVDIPVKVGSRTFGSIFYVMDIRLSYSC